MLLTTLPQELHGLGLLMVEAMLVLEGCTCVSLGTQTPLLDVVQAAQAHRVDVVLLRFSAAQNGTVVLANLRELRAQLPSRIALWVGGSCPALYHKPLEGITATLPLSALKPLVLQWRNTPFFLFDLRRPPWPPAHPPCPLCHPPLWPRPASTRPWLAWRPTLPLLGGLALLAGCGSTTPPAGVRAVTPFSLERYQGRWYEIARLDHTFERGMSDVSAFYTPRPTAACAWSIVAFTPNKTAGVKPWARPCSLVPPPPARSRCRFFGPFYGGYHVAALNPDYRWALVLGPDTSYAWILARDKHPTARPHAAIVPRAQALGVNTEALIWVTHTRTDPRMPANPTAMTTTPSLSPAGLPIAIVGAGLAGLTARSFWPRRATRARVRQKPWPFGPHEHAPQQRWQH